MHKDRGSFADLIKAKHADHLDKMSKNMTVDEQLHEEANRRLPHFMIRLIEPYRLTTYWFEIVECLRKVAIVGLPAFFYQGSVEQVLLGQLTAVTMFGVFLVLRPSDDAGDNFRNRFQPRIELEHCHEL